MRSIAKFYLEVMYINYTLLYDGDVFQTDLKQLIATNRNLPLDWCTRYFTERPSFEFAGLHESSNEFLQHLKNAENGGYEKFQIIVDSDLDGICSAAIVYKFLHEFFPKVKLVYTLHSAKKHGLSSDIEIQKGTTLVLIPDAGVNDIEQCKALADKNIDVLILDHHIIEQPNPYASIVSCMDGVYPNQNLCGTAVTWLFLYGFSFKCLHNFNDVHHQLFKDLDLVATATIADLMDVTNEDNMYFIQNGLLNINSNALRTFLIANEVNLSDVTIEDIKFKVAPLISAMIRMGSMPEKDLLFRAFVDDYEEFEYEKRGSFDVAIESIYDRVVRVCKNAKSRQDRAKQKLLNECNIHEYPHVLLVEYSGDKPSPLTGLVANELASKYNKPCIVYRNHSEESDPYGNSYDTGSIRNYDGSPIESFKELLESAFENDVSVAGHDNSAGIRMYHTSPDIIAELIKEHLSDEILAKIGTKEYNVDFMISAEEIDAGFVQIMHQFEKYSGYGFPQVTALVTGIKVCQDNFKTMGKNSFNWKIAVEETGVTYVKFKVDRESDELVQELDDIEWDSERDYGKLYENNMYLINAICTFGLNVYNGEIHPQCIIKDYTIIEQLTPTFDDSDFDLDFDL